MSDKLTTVEESITKVLLDLMTERVMSKRGLSIGLQASSKRGLSASPSTAQVRPSWPADEKRTKHRYDLTSAKLILSILPTYLPPLSGTLNRDSVPRDFEYKFVTVYLLKGICAVCANQENITMLKFSDFNLCDRKVYSMLTPHKYLIRTKEKNSKIVPQSWTHNLAQSTLLNVMNIRHFGRHQ
jgi:hypothetical protein